MTRVFLTIIISLSLFSCISSHDNLRGQFQNPPNEYLPMPFLHLNGHLTKDTIDMRITDAKNISGFGGVTVLPVTANPQHPTGLPCPGMTPEFLTPEYFDRYLEMLNISEKQGTQIILYDDINFPSGTAGGLLHKKHPQYTRKHLIMDEFITKGNKQISKKYEIDSTSIFVAISAMNMSSLEIIDLKPYLENNNLKWDAPVGNWRIMLFTCDYDRGGVHAKHVDYMEPEAVSKFMEMTFYEYDKHFKDYFGTTIAKTFFDDVGFVGEENAWTPLISKVFEDKYGKNPALYYPALYYDIGPETQSARVAFFDTRSELMAEGYVKQTSEWAGKRNMKNMGHPPANYTPNSVISHGDILKYYRHVQIPLMDAIFYYGHGMHGFKQISSAADLEDKPIVGAELCGAFSADMDSLTLYRTTIDAISRGVNFVVPHGMWYNTDKDRVRIPPLIAPENPLLRDCLPHYSKFVGRSCLMLQGGNRISDIAVLWPITALQGTTHLNTDNKTGLPESNWLPEYINHHVISNLLTNKLHRDFTYIHPEDLGNGKMSINGDTLRLNNKINFQNFKVLIIPGGDVISADALNTIKQYYENGGKVIFTGSLPNKSAEFGKHKQVLKILSELFEVENSDEISDELAKVNDKGGSVAFVKEVSEQALNNTFERMNINPDVAFDSLLPEAKLGYVNYIHKQNEGKDIYFISNTTENKLSLSLTLRGKIETLEMWDPHSGQIEKVEGVNHTTRKDGRDFTSFDLKLPAVSSIFIVGHNSVEM